VKITRRAFCYATMLTSLAPGLLRPALAQTPSATDLLQPGPLGEMVLGAENAPVTIIEYASMTCGHCAEFHNKTYPRLKERYIDTGKVRFIFREFPLDPLAAGAFMLARCAGKDDTGKYFALVETLFHQQRDWVVQRPLGPLKSIAKQAGFTEQAFEQCLANQQVLDGIEIGRLGRVLRHTDGEIREHEGRLERLRREQGDRRRDIDDEREALSRQIQGAYRAGREEQIKLLLNQEDPAAFGRMLVYYDYLNRARTERIERIAGHLRRLAELADEIDDTLSGLARARERQQSELQAMESTRERREKAVSQFERLIR
jgi:hypothetical protein